MIIGTFVAADSGFDRTERTLVSYLTQCNDRHRSELFVLYPASKKEAPDAKGFSEQAGRPLVSQCVAYANYWETMLRLIRSYPTLLLVDNGFTFRGRFRLEELDTALDNFITSKALYIGRDRLLELVGASEPKCWAELSALIAERSNLLYAV